MEMCASKKKAVVIGGSNGIGFSIVKKLVDKDYQVVIVDKVKPDDEEYVNDNNCEYVHSNLLYFDEELFLDLSSDKTIDTLMLTAGFGRVTNFENLHISEIENSFRVNTIALLKVISLFYDRIKSNDTFYCGVMCSIAGCISSPKFSVYASTKAALWRFVESVNAELQSENYTNRILNVSPGSIKGTKFNGAPFNQEELTSQLAEEILSNLYARNLLYIPEYETIFKGVIERYNKDSIGFGLESYKYKQESGRNDDEKKVKIGYLSGTFDLFHVGHLNLLRRAKEQCDYLIVGIHPDAKHKGKVAFIPYEERKEIVSCCKYVDKVVKSCLEDSDAWEKWHYNRLFVGSDYKGTERFNKYESYFKDKGVEIVYFPYTTSTSSTQIREKIIKDKCEL